MNAIRFLNKNGKHLAEVLGYTPDLFIELGNQFMDIFIDYERELLELGADNFNHHEAFRRCVEFLYTSDKVNPLIQAVIGEANLILLVSTIISDLMWIRRVAVEFQNERDDNKRQYLISKFGNSFGNYAYRMNLIFEEMDKNKEEEGGEPV